MYLVCNFAAILSAQNAPIGPTFEVASVRRNTGQPGPPLMDGRAFRQSGRVTVTNMTVLALEVLVIDDIERPTEN